MTRSELDIWIQELEEAIQLPTKERPPITTQVDAICNYADQHSLPADAISKLISIVTQRQLDVNSAKALIQSLYPKEPINKQVVYSIVAALGAGAQKPPPAIQAELLRWLVLAKDALEDPKALAHVYAVLFNLVDFLGIRADLCHILAVSTEKRHVVPFRINVLLDMQAATGSDPAVTALLKVYRSFRPDLVPDEAVSGRSSTFGFADEILKARFRIEESNLGATLQDDEQFRVLGKTVVRAATSFIPRVKTHGAEDSSIELGAAKLEDINGVDEFAEKFSKLILPTKMASALNDPLFQHYLELLPVDQAKPHIEAVDREVGKALAAQQTLLQMGEPLDKGCLEILRAGISWAERFKSLLPSIKSFCLEALTTEPWQAHAELFINLLAWSNPYDQPDWSRGILSPQHETCILQADDGQVLLLTLYTRMVRHRHLLSALGTADATSSATLEHFVSHVSTLALSILTNTSSAAAYTAVASYMQSLADIATVAPPASQPFSLVPFDLHVVYLLIFSAPNLSILSQLCGALADQKETIFRVAGSAKDHALKPGLVSGFNGFIMDLSNLLWRCRAFCSDPKQDANAKACLMSADTVNVLHAYVGALKGTHPPYNAHNYFTFSFHPALALVAVAAWRELEDEGLAGVSEEDEVRHRGPVTRASLHRVAAEGGVAVDWTTFRLRVLQVLSEFGAPGVDDLMKTTIKALMPDV